MKKKLNSIFIVAAVISTMVFAQSDMQPSKVSGKTITIPGVPSDGGRTLVSDDDDKKWDVENPEALRKYDGEHLIVKAKPGTKADAIYVMSVKIPKDHFIDKKKSKN